MCGFVGFYNLQRERFVLDDNLLHAMQDKIVHRGPDALGTWKSSKQELALAARRLKIIDLSDAANQPMVSEEHHVVVCLNGEIYNHEALRKELESLGYRYTTNSDTETVIYAYKAWGINCLRRFEGMFAIALFDDHKKVFYLVRDRIGVKPLYFSLQGGILSFASEIKALWPLPWLEKRMNARAWYHYLTFMVTPAPLTIFEGVYKMPAGFYALVDEHKRLSFHEWYNPVMVLSNQEKKNYDSEEFCVRSIRQLLVESIHKRMVADVSVGAYLSGGLDSSLNVALMASESSRIKTFTIAFADDQDNNELASARVVAERFGTQHHEMIITEKEAFDFYERMVDQLDEPLADCVCIPFYYVSLLAHQHGMKVVQVGEGADELFFGYQTYARYAQIANIYQTSLRAVPPFMRRGLARAIRPFLHSSPRKKELMNNWSGARAIFWGGAIAFGESEKYDACIKLNNKKVHEHDHVLSQIYPGMSQEIDSHAIIDYHRMQLKERDPHADLGKQMLYIELKQRLPELLLMRADKMAMAASIEAREPYLDHALVEFMLNVPMHLRFKNNTTKYLLKRAAEGLLSPDIIYRKKIGFSAPTLHWFNKGRYFPSYFKTMSDRATNLPICRGALGLGAVDAFMNNNDAHRAVQNWVLQQLWTFSREQ